MKTIVKPLLSISLFIGLMLYTVLVFGQPKQIDIPELNASESGYSLEFTEDPEFDNVISAYMQGVTESDSLRFRAKGTHFPQRVAVMVITEDKNIPVKVDIVKKHWEDFRKGGQTVNGKYQTSFDTVGEFGIVVSSSKPGVPFYLAVWTTGEIIPQTASLFFPVNSNSINKSNTAIAENGANNTSGGQESSNTLMYVVIGLLAIIAILLFLFLMKNRNKTAVIFLFLVFSQSFVYADAWNISYTGFSRGRVGANIKFDDVVKMMQQLEQARSLAEALENWLSPEDKDDQPQMDPAEQPQLPSSCIQAYGRNSGSDAPVNSKNQAEGKEGKSAGDPDSDSGIENTGDQNRATTGRNNSNTSFNPMNAAEGSDTSKPLDPDLGRSSNSDGPSLQLPRYDSNGDLINTGDFPDAPSHIDPAGKSRAANPYFENAGGSSKPIYDENGHLKNPDEFPDAPDKIDLNSGMPPMRPVLQGQQQQGSSWVKQPVYDQNGTLIDSGDYPYAPSKIDVRSINQDPENPFTGEFSPGFKADPKPKNDGSSRTESGSLSTTSTTISASTSSGSNNRRAGNSNGSRGGRENTDGGFSSSPGGSDPGGGESKSNSGGLGKGGPKGGGRIGPGGGGGSNDDNSQGCECLRKAYEKLEDQRVDFEKLRIITARMERQVSFGLSFGDNVAGIHGVLGVVWQSQRVKILESLQKFDNTYENKYQEMIGNLYEILLEIDRCEALLGYENWYNHSGFIYYTYMKDRYKRARSI